jgi:hypothetical protein
MLTSFENLGKSIDERRQDMLVICSLLDLKNSVQLSVAYPVLYIGTKTPFLGYYLIISNLFFESSIFFVK